MKEQDKMRILLEDIKSKVELIAEGHGVLQSGIEQLKDEVGGLRNDFGQLCNKVNRIETKVTQNQITLYALNDKLDEHMRQPAHA